MDNNNIRMIFNSKNKKKLNSLAALLVVGVVVILIGACKKNAQNEETKRLQEETKIEAEKRTEAETQALAETEMQTSEMTTEELIVLENMTEETSVLELAKEETSAIETEAQTQQKMTEAETQAQTEAETQNTTEPSTETEPSEPSEPSEPAIKRLLTSEVVPYDGLPRKITCWGDSLTEGYGTLTSITLGGIAGPTMPSTLAEMTGIEVFNMGIYGELSRDIACRQGGLKMYVNDIVIPEEGSVEISQIICEDGNVMTLGNLGDGNGIAWHEGFDACTIGGITGRLDYNYSDGTYIFTRESAGEVLVIDKDTEVITPQSIDRRNDILVIQMGNNGGWDEDPNVLIAQYDAMILHSDYRYYIIIGDTDFNSELDSDYEWEAALQEAYGDHFLNMREYLCDIDRFAECGLTPNSDDYFRISIGEVPLSFKCDDQTHLNSYGYWLEGIAVYNKGTDLGYWN